MYKAPAFLRKDLISKTKLVLAKRRAYVSLAGSMLLSGCLSGLRCCGAQSKFLPSPFVLGRSCHTASDSILPLRSWVVLCPALQPDRAVI